MIGIILSYIVCAVVAFAFGCRFTGKRWKKIFEENPHRDLRKNLYTIEKDGCTYEYKAKTIIDEHLFQNGIDKGKRFVIELEENND